MKTGKIKLSDLHSPDYQFDHFPPTIMERIQWIMETFAEVKPKTLENWEDGFRRDQHPLREIELLEIMGEGYNYFLEEWKITKMRGKKELYDILLNCTYAVQPLTIGINGEIAVLQDMGTMSAEAYLSKPENKLKYFTPEQLQEIMDFFSECVKKHGGMESVF